MYEWFVRWSMTRRSKLLSAAIFFVFFVLAVAQGHTVSALGWLSFLVGSGLVLASESITRSRTLVLTLSYLAMGFIISGVVLLFAALSLKLFG